MSNGINESSSTSFTQMREGRATFANEQLASIAVAFLAHPVYISNVLAYRCCPWPFFGILYLDTDVNVPFAR